MPLGEDLQSLREVARFAQQHGRQMATVYLPSLLELFDRHDAAVQALAAIRGELFRYERRECPTRLPETLRLEDFSPPVLSLSGPA